MFDQVGFVRELFAAPDAGVRLRPRVARVSRVRLHVRAKIGPVGEGFAAVGAAVGLLSRVRPQMPLQQPGARERLAANLTFVAEVVGEEMHGERRHRYVDFVAMRAFLGALHSGWFLCDFSQSRSAPAAETFVT